LGNGKIRGSGSVVVGMERDLLVGGAAGERAVQNLAEFVDLVPADDAFFNRIEDPGLPFLFDRLAPIGNDEVCAPDCFIVVLAPTLFEPSAFDERAVRADDS
jgi:hypothetical protein